MKRRTKTLWQLEDGKASDVVRRPEVEERAATAEDLVEREDERYSMTVEEILKRS